MAVPAFPINVQVSNSLLQAAATNSSEHKCGAGNDRPVISVAPQRIYQNRNNEFPQAAIGLDGTIYSSMECW